MTAVAVLGNLSLDEVDGGPPRPGGGPFHAARTLRMLGRPALLLARCAAPDRPRLLPHLAGLGLPVHWRDAETTAAFSFFYDGDRRVMAVDAVGDAWTPEHAAWANGVLRGVGWAQVAPLFRTDFPQDVLAMIARGRRLLYDGQGLVRVARQGSLAQDGEFDPEVLRHVSILKLGEEEAEVVAGGVGERELAALGVPEVVVTLGSRGSIVLHDGLAEHVPVRPLVDIDPTGAGDGFSAAYLVARSAGFAPPAAARWASGAVAAVLTGTRR
jgi:sugar/nucleoside kinase (ribokinase family)